MKRRVIFRRIEGNLYYSFCENPISCTLQPQSQYTVTSIKVRHILTELAHVVLQPPLPKVCLDTP